MPFKTGVWGEQAKARSKRRLKYFRERVRELRRRLVPFGLGWRSIGRLDVKALVERANGKCERCGATEKLLVHHKDEKVENNTLENLLLLCRGCHNTIHKSKKEQGGLTA